jgi:phosphoribosyl-AMP cyclohydrolase
MKGESSGHTQEVIEIRYDCDADCLLVLVNQNGAGACHTGERSCFYRALYPSAGPAGVGEVGTANE